MSSYPELKTESYELLGGINSKASPYVNGPTEFRDLTNLDFFIPGALNKRPGTALYTGATIAGRLTAGVEFQRLNGSSQIIVSANTNVYSATQSSFTAIKSGLTNGLIFDFVVFVDRLFAANGAEFFKYDGTNTSNFSLPAPPNTFGLTAVVGGSLTSGVTGTFVGTYAYLNDRAYFGPAADGVTITINGVTFNSIAYYGLTTPPSGFGVSAIALYRSSINSSDPVGTTNISISQVVSGATFIDAGMELGTELTSDALYFTLIPKYFEIYNNQLFMAGFSGFPSTVFWSDIGEPESIQPEFFAEFRTNDGDVIKGMKTYNGSLIVAKKKSFHRITGDNPNNFLFQEISDQYGCISNQAMVVYENLLWFLDPKGIVEYNGAQHQIISDKIEPIFTSMNQVAAQDNAYAIHHRLANQVWFAIPCNGATLNNTIVVYDYIVKAWTKFEGVKASSLFLAQGALPGITPLVGGYTGSLSYFGVSLVADLGQAITCMMDTYYSKPRGQTEESQFRMFYLNMTPILDPVASVMDNITIYLKKNYGQTIEVTRTMSQNPFQSRVQFGIPARSLAAQVFHVSATLPLTIQGYAFASRFQRNV